MTILDLFRAGMDTSVIKTIMRAAGQNVDEAFVYNEIHRLREKERLEKERRERRRAYRRNWQRAYRNAMREAARTQA